MDINVLKTEINTDPKNLGYAGKTDQEIADLMNEIGLSQEQILRGAVPAEEMLSAMVYDDLILLTDVQLQIIAIYTANGDLDIANPNIQRIFKQIFPQGKASRDSLLALVYRSASRAEIVFSESGIGVIVRNEGKDYRRRRV